MTHLKRRLAPRLTLAEILRADLVARGLPDLPLGQCEAIVARLLDHAGGDGLCHSARVVPMPLAALDRILDLVNVEMKLP